MRKLLLVMLSALIMPAAIFARAEADKPLPSDPAVRTGVLANGMKYYIRHNDSYPGLAHFEIFHAVGAIQEEDNQNGLAHFLEHMAFNGLEHFPGKSMMQYMESIGVKWGANLNAATSTDYTRYLLKDVPVSREGVIDTCLLVLYDWSGGILADPATLDNERGVIQEEWRSRGDVGFRISQAVVPYVYKDSKYAERNIIGDMDIIRTFTRDELMDFYHTWYRPDQQAVAVVGDFNVDDMEAKVVALFSQLPAAVNPRPKVEYNVPDNEGMLYVAFADPEIPESSFEILWKHPATPKELEGLESTFVDGYYNYLVTAIMGRRMNDKFNNGVYPAKGIDYSYSSLVGDRDVFSISGTVRSGAGNIVPAVEMAIEESERMRRYGFTASEVERVLASARSAVENAYLDRGERPNSRFIDAMLANFLRNSPYMDMETYRDVQLRAIDNFTVEEANARVKRFFGDRNIVVTMITPQSEASGVPSEEFMAAAIAGMGSLDVTPYEEKPLRASLMVEEPVPGKVVGERKVAMGATEWILSNGLKIYLLPTTRHDNEIQLDAFTQGGHSVLPDEMFSSARMVAGTVVESGVADLTATDLSRILAGRKVFVTPYFSEYLHGLDCATTPADLETTLQLMNLYLTQPRFDQEYLDRRLSTMREELVARKSMPMAYLQDTVINRRSDYHPRSMLLITDTADIKHVKMDDIRRIYKQAFGNPGQFTYLMTGAFDPDAVRPLIEKYIGSLPVAPAKGTWRDIGKRPPKGHATADFTAPMEQPLTTIFVEYTQQVPEYSYRESLIMVMLQQVLETRFTRIIREERGATYSVDMEGSIKRIPEPERHLIVSFQTKPELVDGLRPLIDQELRKVISEGVDPEEFAKSKEYTTKRMIQGQESNLYWEGLMKTWIQYGELNDDPVKVIDSITAEDIRSTLQSIVDADNVLTVIMRPEE